ncbi:MAG: adenylate/guanylate cyclase domain-containing protein [Verrucomicrobiaceae bacterium]|nr:adenylate/guanylate cyclase domain-containing protein [Verrucomicrobiaceae bacterium]
MLHTPLQYGGVILVAFAVAGISVDALRPMSKFMVIFAVIIVIIAATPVLAMYGVLFEPVSVFSTALLAGIAGVLFSRTESGRRKLLFLQVSRQRACRKVMTELARRPFGVSLKGESRGVTVLACRIANGSDLCGDLRACEVIELSNYFCSEAVQFVLGNGGYLDEWGPGGVRFCFGLPIEDESHAATACRVAFELKIHLEKIRAECEERWQVPVKYGISLVSGDMPAGLIGSGSFTRFSVIGEEAGLAERMCDLSLNYGPAVFISGDASRSVKEQMEFRLVALLDRGGDKGPTEVNELLNVVKDCDDDSAMRRDEYSRGFVCFREGDFVSALEHFKKACPASGTDKVLAYYQGLAEENIRRGSDAEDKTMHVDVSI